MGKREVVIVVDPEANGKLGGLARAENLSAEERQEASRQASIARWKQHYIDHPEQLKARKEREAKRGKVKRGRPPKKKGKG